MTRTALLNSGSGRGAVFALMMLLAPAAAAVPEEATEELPTEAQPRRDITSDQPVLQLHRDDGSERTVDTDQGADGAPKIEQDPTAPADAPAEAIPRRRSSDSRTREPSETPAASSPGQTDVPAGAVEVDLADPAPYGKVDWLVEFPLTATALPAVHGSGTRLTPHLGLRGGMLWTTPVRLVLGAQVGLHGGYEVGGNSGFASTAGLLTLEGRGTLGYRLGIGSRVAFIPTAGIRLGGTLSGTLFSTSNLGLNLVPGVSGFAHVGPGFIMLLGPVSVSMQLTGGLRGPWAEVGADVALGLVL